MEPIRTDLAVERTAAAPSLPGVTQETRGNAFSVTEIRIKNDVCGAPIGKPAGRYVTLEAPAISRSSANYQEMAEELAAELGKFLPQEGCVFLAGLGNRAITPDALGPRVASKVLATRHLRPHCGGTHLSAGTAASLRACRRCAGADRHGVGRTDRSSLQTDPAGGSGGGRCSGVCGTLPTGHDDSDE